MAFIEKILVRTYYAEHGTLLGIEDEEFFKKIFRAGKPSEDDLVQLLGIDAVSMRPSTKLAMIEGLARGDIDFVCKKLGVSSKKECWDLAHHEDWQGSPIAISKPMLTDLELQLLDSLTAFLTLEKRVQPLSEGRVPIELRTILYARAKHNKGRVPKTVMELIKNRLPKFKYKVDLPCDFLISGETLFSRHKISQESLGKVVGLLPENIAFRGAYMTFNDYTLFVRKFEQASYGSTFVYLIALASTMQCTVNELLGKLGFKWINAIEDFNSFGAVLQSRPNQTTTVLTQNSRDSSNFVVFENQIVLDLISNGKLGTIAWTSDGKPYFDGNSQILLDDIYMEGENGYAIKNDFM